ncbi:MAG: hypothetical protein ACYSW3_29270, partial [Planctomycetota bacterium]
MGNTKARRSIAAASRTEQTDLQLRTPSSLKFHTTPSYLKELPPSLFVSGHILPTFPAYCHPSKTPKTTIPAKIKRCPIPNAVAACGSE